MLGITDLPPPPTLTSERRSVTIIDDDLQDHLSYTGSAETAGDASTNSFRMTMSTVASASTAASEYSFNNVDESGVSPVDTLKMDQMLTDRKLALRNKRSLPSLLPSYYAKNQDALPQIPSTAAAGEAHEALVPPPGADVTARPRSHSGYIDRPASLAAWPVFETQPRARARPASPSTSTLPSRVQHARPSAKTVAALLSVHPLGSSDDSAGAEALPESSFIEPLSPLSAFPLPPSTFPLPPLMALPKSVIPAHIERSQPLGEDQPHSRVHAVHRRIPRRPSTSDAVPPAGLFNPPRPSTSGSSHAYAPAPESSSSTRHRHSPPSSFPSSHSRPSTPSGKHALGNAFFPPSPPEPSVPLPVRPGPVTRPSLPPSAKAALILGVGEPGRIVPEPSKKGKLLRKLMHPRPHTADSATRSENAARRDAERARHEAEKTRHEARTEADVMHAIHSFVYSDPAPEWPRAKKPKQPQSGAALKGRSGWW